MGATAEEQAVFFREKFKEHIALAEKADVFAAFAETEAGKSTVELLQRQVAGWTEHECWGELDDKAKREQGKALRSRELLGYFTRAKETAAAHRVTAQEIADKLERGVNAGRIQRA